MQSVQVTFDGYDGSWPDVNWDINCSTALSVNVPETDWMFVNVSVTQSVLVLVLYCRCQYVISTIYPQ